MEDLRAVDIEWRRNDDEFKSLRKQGGMSDIEADEFAEFVDGLKRQVFDGCREVRALGGDPDKKGVKCGQLENEQGKASDLPDKAAHQASQREPLDAESESANKAGQRLSKEEQQETVSELPEKADQRSSQEKQSGADSESANQAGQRLSKEEQQEAVSELPEKADQRPSQENHLGADSGSANKAGKQPAGDERPGKDSDSRAKKAEKQPSQKKPRGAVASLPALDQSLSPQTEAEKLRRQLDGVEAELDGILQIEMRKVSEKAANKRQTETRASAGGGSGAGAGRFDSESTIRPTEPGAGPGVKKEEPPPQWNLPEGVGDGSDDDVVARQLREAAQAETDPVLKEQLWREYKKYKASM